MWCCCTCVGGDNVVHCFLARSPGGGGVGESSYTSDLKGYRVCDERGSEGVNCCESIKGCKSAKNEFAGLINSYNPYQQLSSHTAPPFYLSMTLYL